MQYCKIVIGQGARSPAARSVPRWSAVILCDTSLLSLATAATIPMHQVAKRQSNQPSKLHHFSGESLFALGASIGSSFPSSSTSSNPGRLDSDELVLPYTPPPTMHVSHLLGSSAEDFECVADWHICSLKPNEAFVRISKYIRPRPVVYNL